MTVGKGGLCTAFLNKIVVSDTPVPFDMNLNLNLLRVTTENSHLDCQVSALM